MNPEPRNNGKAWVPCVLFWMFLAAVPLVAAETVPRGQSKAELGVASRFLTQATLGTDIRLIREVARGFRSP